MKTLRMIWNETPFGCRILDASYLAFTDFLQAKAKTSIVRFVKLTGIDLWGMTPSEATRVVQCWHDKQDAIDIRDWNEREALFWSNASFSSCHPPRTV